MPGSRKGNKREAYGRPIRKRKEKLSGEKSTIQNSRWEARWIEEEGGVNSGRGYARKVFLLVEKSFAPGGKEL